MPSLLAAIGEVVEAHMVRTGFLQASDKAGVIIEAREPGAHARAASAPARPRACPRCASLALVRDEGCWVCRDCGFTRCG